MNTPDLNDFYCAICGHRICMKWNYGKADKIIAPLCRSCEQDGGTPPKHGSFRDRREVVRGFALADALQTEALWQQHGWGSPYVRP